MSPLTSEEKSWLLRLARHSLEARLTRGPGTAAAPDLSLIPSPLREPAGAFVTLHKSGELRGCVGQVEPRLPLYRAVMEIAVAAALTDPRFAPVRADELAELELEISVLSPCRLISPDEIRIGVHGLLITQGSLRGLLLPQVAVERRWSAERFLEETCRKAGLNPGAWRSARLEVFEA